MLDALYQSIDPVAFEVGPFAVRWYGIAYVLGFICAAVILYVIARKWKLNINTDAVLTVMVCVVIGIIVGARLGYTIMYGNGFYFEHPLQIFAFNQGGMSFHGGLVGCLIGGIVAMRLTEIPFLTLADLGAIAAPLGLFFGRCANFINGELWGAPTDLPWGVVFGGVAGSMPRHPSQLYEAVLEGIIIFAVLLYLASKRPPLPQGTFIGTFMLLYGVFRFLIEFVREPDIQIGYLYGGWLTMGQVLSLPLIVAGAGLLIFAAVTKRPQEGMPVYTEEELTAMDEAAKARHAERVEKRKVAKAARAAARAEADKVAAEEAAEAAQAAHEAKLAQEAAAAKAAAAAEASVAERKDAEPQPAPVELPMPKAGTPEPVLPKVTLSAPVPSGTLRPVAQGAKIAKAPGASAGTEDGGDAGEGGTRTASNLSPEAELEYRSIQSVLDEFSKR